MSQQIMAKFRKKVKIHNYRKLPAFQLQSSGMYFDFELAATCDDIKLDSAEIGRSSCDYNKIIIAH